MKITPAHTNPAHRHVRAFTLIELLVVIVIIAILAGLALPAGRLVIKKAYQASARNDAKQLEAAIKSYYLEYNRYPVLGSSREGPYETNKQLIDVLMYNDESPDVREFNPRGVSFFEPSRTTNNVNGHGYVDSTRDYNDPWGNPYKIYLDHDYDNAINTPSMYSRSTRSQTIKKGVLVHSGGPDSDFNKIRDNVTSWRGN